MGQPRLFEPEKLVIAVLSSQALLRVPGFRQRLLDRLERAFGPIDYTSSELPFAFTHYYDEELGCPLCRLFVAFRTLVEPCGLTRLKLAANALEDEFREPAAGRRRAGEHTGPRRVNLDPGLLSLSRFVLASTKDSSHRIPLAEGIYGEITLQYQRPSFRPVPWTYPDYRSEEVRRILLEIRELFRIQKIERRSDESPDGEERQSPPPTEPQPD